MFATIRHDSSRALYPDGLAPGPARNGMHKYNNQDHAMMTSPMLTAKDFWPARAVYDIWNVNEDAKYHEGRRIGAGRAALGGGWVAAERRSRTAAA